MHGTVIACNKCGKRHENVTLTKRDGNLPGSDPLYGWDCPETGKRGSGGPKRVELDGAAPTPPKAPKPPKPSKGADTSADGAGNDVAAHVEVNVNNAPSRTGGTPERRPAGGGGVNNNGCKTHSFALKTVQQYDLCPASGLPIIQGIMAELADHAMAGGASHPLLAAADARWGSIDPKGNCCSETERDLGRDLGRLLREFMAHTRMTPQQWALLYPRELAEAYQQTGGAGWGSGAPVAGGGFGGGGGGGGGAMPGGLPRVEDILGGAGEVVAGALPQLPGPISVEPPDSRTGADQTDTAIGDTVIDLGTRVAAAASGAAIGGEVAGPYGMIAGGIAGLFFPEAVGKAEDAVQGVFKWGGGLAQQATSPKGIVPIVEAPQ